jgi:hypothetical protein
MKSTNLPSGALRQANVGLCWEEKLTNTVGTIYVSMQGTVRVHALGATTVTIDGVLAMTMAANMIEYFNVGAGAASDNVSTITVVIAGANANVQVAKEKDPGRRTR